VERIFPVVFAFALLAGMWIGRSAMASSQPWRVELSTTLVACLAGVWFIFLGRTADQNNDLAAARPYGLLLGAFAFWGLASGVWAGHPISVVHHTIVWCEYIFFFTMTILWLRRGRWHLVLTTLMITAAIVGILTLIDYSTLENFESQAKVLRARYTAYAEMLATIAPLAIAVTLYRRKLSRMIAPAALAALGWFAVMLSTGKSGFLGGVIGTATFVIGYLAFGDRIFRRRILIAGAIWLALTAGVQLGSSRLTEVPGTVDYISGKADPKRETSLARVFLWRVGAEMVREHWLIGVGADNFGAAFNEARAVVRTRDPDSPFEEPVPEYLVERAHNEPLQILAELGIIGLILAGLPFGYLLYRTVLALRECRRLSLMFWAGIGGMTAFGASSMASSFSLRIVQNGIVFFMAFGIAVYEEYKSRPRYDRDSRASEPLMSRPLTTVAVSGMFVVMLIVLALKGMSEGLSGAADRTTDAPTAIAMYDRAATLDPDNPMAVLKASTRSFDAKEYAIAAERIRIAIDAGLGVDLTYSALADCYEKLDDPASAQRTFEEALRIFPHDIFLQVRYAVFLQKLGRNAEADEHLGIARKVDLRFANGWYALLTKGSVRAFYQSRSEHDTVAEPSELKPDAAVLQYLDKAPDGITQP
jgi:O-antigen ligase